MALDAAPRPARRLQAVRWLPFAAALLCPLAAAAQGNPIATLPGPLEPSATLSAFNGLIRDINSRLDAIRAETGYFGAASRGVPSWVSANWSGAAFDADHAVLSVSRYGMLGGLFASRTSDSADPSTNVFPVGILVVDDNAVTAHGSFAAYLQSSLLSYATGSGHLQVESSVYNEAWTAGTLDPYTDNAAAQIVNFRLDCGIGSGTPRNCSSPLQIVNNGAAYKAGIIFGDNSLVRTAGIASAIELPQDYAIDWFSGAGAVAYRVYGGASFLMTAHGKTMISFDASDVLHLDGGASCPAGIDAGTFRSVNGVVTHC